MNKRLALRKVVTEMSEAQFEYGVRDCCQFAARQFELVKGWNPAKRFQYTGDKGATGVIEANGGLSGIVEQFCDIMVNKEELEIGDIALIDFKGNELLGLQGANGIIALTDGGFMNFPPRYVTKGWRL